MFTRLIKRDNFDQNQIISTDAAVFDSIFSYYMYGTHRN